MSEIEFSRRVKLDEISAAPGRHSIAANEAERRLLAERFALPAIERLEAEIDVSREAAGVRAKGRVRAAVTQECVVSGQPVGQGWPCPRRAPPAAPRQGGAPADYRI